MRNIFFSISIIGMIVISASAQGNGSCSYFVDPPQYMRNGGDFASLPGIEGLNGTIADCIQACCNSSFSFCNATTNCVSFSYNNPQPERACINNVCCEEGGICCMLKNTMPATSNNTYGPSVTTGVLLSGIPAPTPPFPPSTFITGVNSFGQVSWWGEGTDDSNHGDTWPSFSDAQGNVYGWACDSRPINATETSPMALYQLVASPSTIISLSSSRSTTASTTNPPSAVSSSLTPVLIAQDPIDYSSLCKGYGQPGMGQNNINVKPAGAMALSDGVTFITGTSCMTYQSDPLFNRQPDLGGFIAKSTDGGKTWTNATAVGAFPGRFAAPTFISCGNANDACTAKDGGYLYVFFTAGFDNVAYWDNNDAVYLARVNESTVFDVSSYEYYVGMSTNNDSSTHNAATATTTPTPQWIADPDQAQPVFSYGRMIGENSIFYNPYLRRYVMANFGFLNWQGQPVPWHDKTAPSPKRTQLLFLESPQPWGPWSVFYRDDNSNANIPGYLPNALGAPGMYTPSFPSAYHTQIDASSGTANMTMIFSCLDFDDSGYSGCRYTLNWQTITLQLNMSQL